MPAEMVRKTVSIRADQNKRVKKMLSLNLSGFLQERLDEFFEEMDKKEATKFGIFADGD